MEFKYIIFSPHGDDLPDFGVAFSPTLQHKQVATAFANAGTPVSAGFIRSFVVGGEASPYCHGASDSLKLAAREGDDAFFTGLF